MGATYLPPEMIYESAPKAPNRENLTIRCAAGAPPHVPAGTRRTHFTSKLEEYRSSVTIPLAWNVCARHFCDVTGMIHESVPHALFGHTGGVRFSRPLNCMIFYI